MDTLPDLPLFEVLIKLSTNDLKSLCHVNNRLCRFLSDNEYFWQTKCATHIKFKYYPSWYQTYKRIKTIPIYINIDNSHIFGGTDFYLYTGGQYHHLECNYNNDPHTYINHYPGEPFETIINKTHELVCKLTPNFAVMYFRDSTLLRISHRPSKLYSVYHTGLLPNKILVFNDPYIINNFYTFCFNTQLGLTPDTEYYRETIRMFCKRMIQQYPKINIKKLIEPLECDDRIDLDF